MTPLGESQFIKKINDVVHKHISDEHFGVSELAEALNISRVTLHRRVRKNFNKTVNALIREIRLKKAWQMLQNNDGSIADIAYSVGFGSATYFNKCFRDNYGYPPGDVLKGNKIQTKTIKSKSKTISKKASIPIVIFLIVSFTLIGLLDIVNIKNNQSEVVAIAVLPAIDKGFRNNSCTILEGFREYLIVKLNTIEHFKVSPNLSTEKYRNSDKSAKRIARELDARYLITISGQSAGNLSTIWVQLIDIHKNTNIWSYPI